MTKPLHEIDAATRGVAIRKSDYGRLFGLTPTGVAGQVKRGKLVTVVIGGAELIRTAPIRAALGLPTID